GIPVRGRSGRAFPGRHQPPADRGRVGRRGDVAAAAGGAHAPLDPRRRLPGRPLSGRGRHRSVFDGERGRGLGVHPPLLRPQGPPRQGGGAAGHPGAAGQGDSAVRPRYAGRAGQQPHRPRVLALAGVPRLRHPHGDASARAGGWRRERGGRL
ncbi:MAG: hypothetical protein AVDCRST_MAG89-3825, partial [uncultured Gemmatimonadetes bacterium]